ncbi:Lrp/AsnC family transcriptional regulator [Bartonella sp. DGB2]|uniref:Lrp/AsnC family transcriptional regulator n=1 Tax=Bartonella sp. DGB2 TaxID=3388426 RepID=UPI00398FB208
MEKSIQSSQLDKIDKRIIAILANNGRLSLTQLAEQVGLSKTPCQVRLKRLINEGYITGFRAILNLEKLGLNHIAFTEVKLTTTKEETLHDFNQAVKKIYEVEECHMIASAFDYLLKVRTRDIHHYRVVLGEKISTLPNVASTSTFIVMQNVIDNNFQRQLLTF